MFSKFQSCFAFNTCDQVDLSESYQGGDPPGHIDNSELILRDKFCEVALPFLKYIKFISCVT